MIGRFPWEPFPPGEPEPKGPDPIHRTAYQAAVTAADAYRSVRLALRREDGVLRLGNRFVADGRYREVAFVAVGNAAGSMGLAALRAIGDRLTQGFVAGPEAVPDELPFRGAVIPPGLPGEPLATTVVQAATEIIEGLGPSDLLLLLVSPGALRALCEPPPGLTPAEFGGLLARAGAEGASGREIGLIARTLGTGGVGGRLGALARRVDTATFVVERGDGPGLVGGGPIDPSSPAERTEARAALGRLGLLEALPPSARTALAPAADPIPSPATVARPVVVASPSDALRAAADGVFDRGWTSRLAFLQMREGPAEAATHFADRAEELLAAEPLTPESRTKGIAIFAMATLGLAEGVDEGPALATFLSTIGPRLRRREMSVGLYRTAGALGAPEYPPAAVLGHATEAKSSPPPGVARGLPMRPGITDVGALAVVLCGVPAASPPR